ncbi:cell-death-related nuclease 7-like [Perca fluviatilis]|nr:cell-death-related nuclease 7-like [Perca fluviatilis]
MMDKTTGVWLSHSTPRFPFTRDQNDFYPDSGAANAQTFICVTFKYDQFNKIGQHLLDIRAFPFDHQIPKDTNANFHRVIQVTEKNNSPGGGNPGADIRCRNTVRSFAKNSIQNLLQQQQPIERTHLRTQRDLLEIFTSILQRTTRLV